MNQETRNDILRSWKEIAAYLGCDVRTCQRWADGSGLPVFKLGPREAVFTPRRMSSTVGSLKRATDNKPKVPADIPKIEPAKARLPRKRFFLPMVSVLGIALALILFFGLKKRTASGESDWPHDFHIKESKLIIVDEQDRPLWTFDTGFADLLDEKRYRDHFQIQTNFCEATTCLPKIMIRDIQGDPKPEVLFSVFTKGEIHDGTLLCFDSKGTLLWPFEAGHTVVYGSERFSKNFNNRGEEFYILFPYHEIDFLLGPLASISTMQFLKDMIYLYSGPSMILFSMSFRMELLSVTLTHPFLMAHSRLFEEGRIHKPLLKEQTEADLMGKALYWNGKAWVGQVARSNP